MALATLQVNFRAFALPSLGNLGNVVSVHDHKPTLHAFGDARQEAAVGGVYDNRE
jgi:hypothetical protein